MKIIGCDPGKTGAIVTIDTETKTISKAVTPTVGKEIDWGVFADLLRDKENSHIFLEHVHAMFGTSAKATFTFGGCFEGVKALIAALKIPYTLVQPKVWQGVMYQGILEIRKAPIKITTGKRKGQTMKGRRDTKAMSLQAAKRLFPKIDLRASDRCKIAHEGIVDALLIAEYGRRNLRI